MELADYVGIQDIDERANILWEKGIFLDKRIIYNKSKICIYSLFNFFVEVTYAIKADTITHVKALETIEDWEGYMESINLDHLIK